MSSTLLHIFTSIIAICSVFILASSSPSSLKPLSGSDCVGLISEVEYNALEALYNSTDGENWRWLPDTGGNASHWHFPATVEEPCGAVTWEGLRCNVTDVEDDHAVAGGAGCYIRALSLETHNLVGFVPSSLGTLSQLEILDLSYNSITGSLPGELGGMMSLIWFDLVFNFVSQQLPSEIAKLNALEGFYMSYNAVHGTIPSEIGNMTQLFGLYLEGNYLESSIPTEVGFMKSLAELYLHNNHISSTIPSQVCGLRFLFKFNVYINLLSGSIPSCIGEMNNLRLFSVVANLLSGSLPSQLGSVSNLLQLGGSDNFLTGVIPVTIYSLPQLKQLWFAVNYLSGTLSPSIASLSAIYQIELEVNLMSGIIPGELFTAVSGLQSFFVNNNWFSSTIPDSLFNSVSLEYLYLDNNMFIGTISNVFSNASRLKIFSVAANYLTGTIPSSVYRLLSLQELFVDGNFLHGDIDSALNNLTDIQLTDFGSCLLTGSLPDGLSRLSNMKGFDAEFNYLTGTVHLPLPQSPMILQEFLVGSNYLSGSLPVGLASLGQLTQLKASYNLLTGKIDFLFNQTAASGLGQLAFIDLSNNALTGTIPGSMFVDANSRPLSAVVLYQNCFTGSLPSTICQAGNLTSLILDSASSAPACDVRFTGFLKDLFKVVIGKRSLHGTIPECIWSMRLLQTLHLAGNGLGGTLPHNKLLPEVLGMAASAGVIDLVTDDLDADDAAVINRTIYRLNDVNLASNALSGSIPLSWQQWPWQTLDLSGNKLTGILSEGFVINNTCSASEQFTQSDDDYYGYYEDGSSSLTSSSDNSSHVCGAVDLTVNRLSGRIPGAFRFAQGVNILDGNLFDCKSDDMPESDPTTAEYVCGSSDFNNSLILWICLLSLCVCIILCCAGRVLFAAIKELVGDLADGHDTGLLSLVSDRLPCAFYGRSIALFLSFLRRIAALSLTLECFYLCVCMVSYIWMKASPAQYEDQVAGSGYVKVYTLSTHTYQYAWLSTAGYLHGSVPVGLVVVYLFVSLAIIARFLSFPRKVARNNIGSGLTLSLNAERTGSTSVKLLHEPETGYPGLLRETLLCPKEKYRSTTSVGELCRSSPSVPIITLRTSILPTVAVAAELTWYTSIQLVSLVVLHAVVMISVNILYIYVLLTGLSSSYLLFLVQFALSVFKLLWNRYYVGSVVRLAADSYVAVPCCSFMILFTFIISPVLATFFSDNTCFRYFITGQPAVSSPYQMEEYDCFTVCAVECVSYCEFLIGEDITVAASVTPSWQYSYQCSSSLLVNFTPVLLYSFALSGLLVPLLAYLYCQLPHAFIERYVPEGLAARFITKTIYAYKRDGDELLRSRRRKLFNGVNVTSRAYMNIGVLITFGMASPLLAVAVSMDCVNLYVSWKALIQRHLSIFVFVASAEPSLHGISAKEPGREDSSAVSPDAEEYLARLTMSVHAAATVELEETGSVVGGAGSVLWMVVWVAGFFWGLFVFDMYGDIYGAVPGLCLFLVPTIGGASVFYLAIHYPKLARWLAVCGLTESVKIGNVGSPIFDPQCSGNTFDDSAL
jgi:Leucine-rich repeat (LRR) protein